LAGGRLKLRDMFREWQDRGEIPNSFKPEDLAFRFQQSLFGAMFLWTLDWLPESWRFGVAGAIFRFGLTRWWNIRPTTARRWRWDWSGCPASWLSPW
jgi:hypothetical protein